MVGITYEIMHFNGENIEIADGQLQMKHGVYLGNCSKSVIKVHPKVKSVVLNKCQNVTIIVWNCVSGI